MNIQSKYSNLTTNNQRNKSNNSFKATIPKIQKVLPEFLEVMEKVVPNNAEYLSYCKRALNDIIERLNSMQLGLKEKLIYPLKGDVNLSEAQLRLKGKDITLSAIDLTLRRPCQKGQSLGETLMEFLKIIGVKNSEEIELIPQTATPRVWWRVKQ